MDDPLSKALERTVLRARNADELTLFVTNSFGAGQLGRARQIAYELKGRDWLYGSGFEPVLSTVLGNLNPNAGSRGWVYVLSNRAMPGLLKIGFSTKDPMNRALELEGTGVPAAFEVEYDVLVQGPREVEAQVHERLSSSHEAKEFFRASVSEAVDAIRTVIGDQGKKPISEQVRTLQHSVVAPTIEK